MDVCSHMCLYRCAGMSELDMCADMCVDMCTDTSVGIHVDMCVGMYVGMCVDMYTSRLAACSSVVRVCVTGAQYRHGHTT